MVKVVKLTSSLPTFTSLRRRVTPSCQDSKGDSEVFGKITVKMVSQDISTDYVIKKVEISEDKPHPQSPTLSSDQSKSVTVFHYLRWPKHGSPRGTTALLELIDYINKTQMSSGNKPITVMCK